MTFSEQVKANIAEMSTPKLREHLRHLQGANLALRLLSKGDEGAVRHAGYTCATLNRYADEVMAEIGRRANTPKA